MSRGAWTTLLLLVAACDATKDPWHHPRCDLHLPGYTCPAGSVVARCNSSADCTKELQSAVDSCCPLVTFPGPFVYTIHTGLVLRSNMTLFLEPGVELVAQRGTFMDTEGLVSAFNVSNVSIVGNGAQMRMWKQDYARPELGYKFSEARPGLWVVDATDMVISGLAISNTGGDCVELVNVQRAHLSGLTLDNAWRNALSIVGGIDVLVEGCTFSNTGQGQGTAPMNAVDIEPDDQIQPSVNLTFRDCVALNNMGGGFDVSLRKNRIAALYQPPNRPLSITFDNCSVHGTGGFHPVTKDKWPHGMPTMQNGFTVQGIFSGTKGFVRIANCEVTDTQRPGLWFADISPDGAQLIVENVSLRRTGSNHTCEAPASGLQHHTIPTAPIVIVNECRLGLPYCYNISSCCAAHFSNVSVEDTVNRPFLHLDAAALNPRDTHGVKRNDVSGQITVRNPFGAKGYGCAIGGNGSTGSVATTLTVQCANELA